MSHRQSREDGPLPQHYRSPSVLFFVRRGEEPSQGRKLEALRRSIGSLGRQIISQAHVEKIGHTVSAPPDRIFDKTTTKSIHGKTCQYTSLRERPLMSVHLRMMIFHKDCQSWTPQRTALPCLLPVPWVSAKNRPGTNRTGAQEHFSQSGTAC